MLANDRGCIIKLQAQNEQESSISRTLILIQSAVQSESAKMPAPAQAAQKTLKT